MPDEVNYVSYLLTIDEAREALATAPSHLAVVETAWYLWKRTLGFEEYDRKRVEKDGWEDAEVNGGAENSA